MIDAIGASTIIVRIDSAKYGSCLNAELQRLSTAIQNVVVAGLPNISRAVIAIDDAVKPPTYKLCIEGVGLRDVAATYGVIGHHTISNNIWEVYNTLGIEAARTTIMFEITSVMEGHGMTVDTRHIMLLASQMTSRGEVLGITRHGLAKMRESVFNLASVGFEFEISVQFLHVFFYFSSKKHQTTCLTPLTMDRVMLSVVFLRELFWACLPLLELDFSNWFKIIIRQSLILLRFLFWRKLVNFLCNNVNIY